MDNNDLIWQNAKHYLEMLTTNFKYLEANSRNAASSDQPVVGPPSSSEDSRALARPETLPEVYAYIEDRLEVISDHYISTMSQTGYDKIRNEILQHLTQLDQGPVAKEPPFDWRRTPGVNATESRQPEA